MDNWKFERWYVPYDGESDAHYVLIAKGGALHCSCHLFTDVGYCDMANAVMGASKKNVIPEQYMSFVTPKGTKWFAQFMGRQE